MPLWSKSFFIFCGTHLLCLSPAPALYTSLILFLTIPQTKHFLSSCLHMFAPPHALCTYPQCICNAACTASCHCLDGAWLAKGSTSWLSLHSHLTDPTSILSVNNKSHFMTQDLSDLEFPKGRMYCSPRHFEQRLNDCLGSSKCHFPDHIEPVKYITSFSVGLFILCVYIQYTFI